MYKEIEKYLIPDLSNIVTEFLSGSKEYWKTQMNKSIEQFKTRRLSIYMNDYYYLNSEEPVELTLFLRHITDDEIIYETDDNDDNKYYYVIDGSSINTIKREFLSNYDIENDEEDK